MALEFKKGDLFSEDVDAIVNTVNCVGVMGKGVALEFKRRWPKNYAAYRKLCVAKKLRPGELFIFENADLLSRESPRYLVNFPTKDHWRAKSKIEYVSDGLDALREELEIGRIRSIAMPPLGCGNGGLEWELVRNLIGEKLEGLETRIIVLEPFHERDAPEHSGQETIELTFKRAALLKMLGDLEPLFGGGYDRLSLQKLTYFMQSLGIDFGLQFSRNKFGPYSESLKRAFAGLEKQGAMSGFSEDTQITHITKRGYATADEFLINQNSDQVVTDVTRKISHLIEGFESPFGLELLSTVHHLYNSEGASSLRKVIDAFHAWSDLKRDRFSESAIKNAFDRLREDKLLNH